MATVYIAKPWRMWKGMSAPTTPADLLDLKLMPAWVNEPAGGTDYSEYTGDEGAAPFNRERRPPQRGRDGGSHGPKPRGRDDRKPRDARDQRRPGRPPERDRGAAPHQPRERREAPAPLPQVAVRFLPHQGAFESVIAQIKSGSIAYSVFALARLFLEKPERYEVRLTSVDGAPLHQLAEHGPVAADRRLLESGAFAAAKDDFYSVESTQTEPLKGNFSNVARCRLSGTLLGPTNHHSYQPQLRNLYEQRFSRRMSFQDYQRQIEIVSDPAVVEQWKEQARSVTTYTTKDIDPPQTFNSVAEAERHFRQAHLPGLLRSALELTVNGVLSRSLPDRGLGRVIEDAWATEIRSPSKMMQELAGGLRQAGLNIFRHRRGMLFVTPIRIKMFAHDPASVSGSINGVLQTLADAPGLNRKQLAEKLTSSLTDAAAADRVKLSLASDLRWLVSEGYVMEFNDGTLDLPRGKPAVSVPAVQRGGDAQAAAPAGPETASNQQSVVAGAGESPDATAAEQPHDLAAAPPQSVVTIDPPEADDQIGMSVEQSIEPAGESAIAPANMPATSDSAQGTEERGPETAAAADESTAPAEAREDGGEVDAADSATETAMSSPASPVAEVAGSPPPTAPE